MVLNKENVNDRDGTPWCLEVKGGPGKLPSPGLTSQVLKGWPLCRGGMHGEQQVLEGGENEIPIILLSLGFPAQPPAPNSSTHHDSFPFFLAWI